MLIIDVWTGLALFELGVSFWICLFVVGLLRKPMLDRRLAITNLAFVLSMLVWMFGYLWSHNSTDLALSYFWLRVSYAGFCSFGLSWLAYSAVSAKYGRWVTKPVVILLALPPAIAFVGLLTNDWHKLFFSSVAHSGSIGGLSYARGPLFWLNFASHDAYLLLANALYVLRASTPLGKGPWSRALVALLNYSSMAVYLLQAIQVITFSVDLAPVALFSTALLCTVFLVRYRRSDVVRIALAQGIRQMGDAIVVVDPRHRILDANPAFCEVIGIPRPEVLGRPLHEAMAALGGKVEGFDQILATIRSVLDNPQKHLLCDLVMKGPPSRTYEMAIWPVQGPTKELMGHVATVRDVTEARTTTRNLQAAVADMETLHETAVAVTSVHDMDRILGMILGDLRRMTGADDVRITILEQTGYSLAVKVQLDDSGVRELLSPSRTLSELSRSILDSGKACFVENVKEEKARRSSSMTEQVQAYAGVPLIIHDRRVGLLYVTYDQAHCFTTSDRRLIRTLASHAAVAIANAQMFDEVKRVAITDALTELPNHRHLMDRIDEEMARARRSDHPLAVMMIDIDDFKLVNDAHGHTMGDNLLRLVARTIKDALRSTDIVGRYGGDEFLALLPETDLAGASVAAQRVLDAMGAQQFFVPRHLGQHEPEGTDQSAADRQSLQTTIPVQLSIGVAIYPYDSSTRLELISLADTAMYASKKNGGNMATMARSTDSGFLAAQNSTFSVLEGLINAVDGKDRYTRSHSEQVAQYALALADTLGLSVESKRMVRIASLLHDVGKIGIPDRILRKPGPLDDEEREVVQQHPLLSEMIMREAPQLIDVLDAVRHHHERYDGRGYPRGLKDNEIPFLSRVIAVADAYSAMITDRPYRKALSQQEAIAELRKGVGTQFDPELVEPFIRSLDSGARLTEVDRTPTVS